MINLLVLMLISIIYLKVNPTSNVIENTQIYYEMYQELLQKYKAAIDVKAMCTVLDASRIAIAFFVLMCMSFLLKGIVIAYYDTEKKVAKYYPRRRTGTCSSC
jgi:hypothetical protein